MAELLGAHDLRLLALPSGVDGAELAKWRLRDGTTYEELISELTNAIALNNQAMLGDPVYSSLFSTTVEDFAEYSDGATRGMQKRTEGTRPENKRSSTVGHHLPLEGYDRGLGFTMDFLRKARRITIRTIISDFLGDVRENFQQQLLIRFFSNANNQIGTSGYDRPFADASASISYTPPSVEGNNFASSHTHFARFTDDAAGRASAIDAGVYHLWEHGLFPPYHAVIPVVDRDDFVALNSTSPKVKFVERQYGPINYGDGQTAMTMSDERFIGIVITTLGPVHVWATPRLPANYLGIYKTYGARNMSNPLLVRYDPDFGAGAILLAGDAFRLTPLENAMGLHDFGVGVKDPLNGYAAYFAASGGYVDPAANIT